MSNGNKHPYPNCSGCGDVCDDLWLECGECFEPTVELCPACFSSGIELGNHKPWHSYRFSKTKSRPLLSPSWTPSEFNQLLEGLEQFGYGNWNDVARFVDTKGPVECRDAVAHIFVNGTIGRLTYREDLRGSAVDHTLNQPQDVLPQLSPEEDDLSGDELMTVGWLPTRDEFEVESSNDAENLVSILEVGKVDDIEDEVEIALKIAHTEMYQEKQRERLCRKQAVREHGLVMQFFKDHPLSGSSRAAGINKAKRRDSKYDVAEKLKMVARYQTVDEHRQFIASIKREKDLKNRIKDLSRYRKNGINKDAEAEEFEKERLRRNKEKTERKRALESGLDPPSPSRETNSTFSIDLDSLPSVVGLPGYDLLTGNEKKLCTSLCLHPNLYTAYKTCLLRDHSMRRRGQIPRPLHPVGLDKGHRKKIFSFLLQAGWISAY